MSSLFESIRINLPVGIAKSAKAGITNSYSSVFCALNSWCSLMNFNNSKMQAFVAGFNQNDEIINDKVANREQSSFDVNTDLIDVIPDDIAENLHDTMVTIRNNSISESNEDGVFTITGEDGRAYSFYVYDADSAPLVDGYNILISTDKSSTMGNRYRMVLGIKDNKYYLNPILRSIDHNYHPTIPSFCRGGLCLIYDLVGQVYESIQLNEFLINVVSMITNGVDDINTLLGFIKDYTMSKFASVSACARGCRDTLSTYGFFSLVKYLINYVKSIDDVQVITEDNDSYLTLTDNYDFVPSSFVVGLISTAANTLASISGAIISWFHPIIGLAISAISTIATQIVKAINYDYDHMVNASINSNAKSHINAFPLATAQARLNFDEYYTSTKLNNLVTLLKNEGTAIFEVYGGVLVVGLAPSTASSFQEFWPDIVFEFHPGVSDNRKLAKFILDNKLLWHTEISLGVKHLIIDTYISSAIDNIMEYYGTDNYCDQINYFNTVLDSYGNATLSTNQDNQLKQILLANTIIFNLMYDQYNRELLDNTDFRVPVPTSVDPYYSRNLLAYCLDNYSNPEDISWSDIISVFSLCPTLSSNGLISDARITLLGGYILTQHLYSGQPYYLYVSEVKYPIALPSWDKSSLWLAIAIGGLTIVATAAIATITTIKIKKSLRTSRATRAAVIESQWETFKANPTAENYNAYKRSVKRNNLFAKIFGGETVSLDGFWSSSNEPGGKQTVLSKTLLKDNVLARAVDAAGDGCIWSKETNTDLSENQNVLTQSLTDISGDLSDNQDILLQKFSNILALIKGID